MLACRLAVLRSDEDGALAQRCQATQGCALALLTLASLGTLLSRTLELNGGAWNALLPDMRLVLGVTHFGHAWLWRVPALLVLWAGWRLHSRRPAVHWTVWPMLLAVAAIALTRSETGHPADAGDFTLAVWIDWAHVLAAGAWVGSLFGVTLAVFPRLLRANEQPPRRAARIFQRLSTLSGIALAVLVACGLYSAGRQLGSVDALWSTRYGVTFDVKLALVLAMIALGAHNRHVKLPRLLQLANTPARPSWLARLLPLPMRGGRARPASDVLRDCARAVLLESLLGLAVIGATATLIHAMPPAGERAMHGMDATARAQPAPVPHQDFESGPGTAR